jgi:hypothetical protein
LAALVLLNSPEPAIKKPITESLRNKKIEQWVSIRNEIFEFFVEILDKPHHQLLQ